MPRIRLLNDGTAVPASPTIGEDGQDNLVFGAGAGDRVLVLIDATAWIGTGVIQFGAWEAPDGGAFVSPSLTGAVAQAFFDVPNDGQIPWRRGYRVQNTLTASGGGPITRTTIWIKAEGR